MNKLSGYLAGLVGDGLCVAFSGGVDSAVVLKAACELGGNVHAVTLYTPFHAPLERKDAARMARLYGAEHHVIALDEMPGEVMANPPDRCYLCKKAIFEAIRAYAGEQGLTHVLDGTNADDLNEYRPGLRALRELGVKSPLADLSFVKTEVRAIAAEMGLEVASKPSAPCLATRFPYGTSIDPALLPEVDAVEVAVRALGIGVVRARIHGDTVRLEVPAEYLGKIVTQREKVLAAVKKAGFLRATLDLDGYHSGSFDDAYRGKQEG